MSDYRSTVRKSNIELLRIIVMVMIVAHHFCVHGKFDLSHTWNLGYFWLRFIQMGGKIAVDVFVLISGYFLVRSEFHVRKLFTLWTQVAFYAILIYLLFVLAGKAEWSPGTFRGYCLPVTSEVYWFVTAYFAMYLLVPAMNQFLSCLGRRQYLCLLVVLGVLLSVVPTVMLKSVFPFEKTGQDILWFVYLYFVAGYIRLYARRCSEWFWFLGAMLLGLIDYGLAVYTRMFERGSYWYRFSYHAYKMENVLILLISVCLFIGFLNLHIGSHKMINRLGSAMFGVYLIHEHPLLRPYLWEDLFRNADFYDSRWLVPYSIVAVFIVFSVCTGIELWRQKLFSR